MKVREAVGSLMMWIGNSMVRLSQELTPNENWTTTSRELNPSSPQSSSNRKTVSFDDPAPPGKVWPVQ